MVSLFIDTNVLLSFYAFTPDDLTRLERLADHVNRGEVVIFKNRQLEDEFRRNRENKIETAMKDIEGRHLNLNLPRLCDAYPEVERLKEIARDYSRLHGELVKKVRREVKDHSLRADEVVREFFAIAIDLPLSPDLLQRARLRTELGNPPGKKNSIGDAIHWEALLERAPKDGLYYVTDDSDHYSPYDPTRAHEFLVHEWEEKAGTPLTFYRRLSQLPEISEEALPVEDAQAETDELVEMLALSGSFATTHAAIAQLSGIRSFTPAQVRSLVWGLIQNNQVGWILTDTDLFEFYERLAKQHGASLDPDERKRLEVLLDGARLFRQEHFEVSTP